MKNRAAVAYLQGASHLGPIICIVSFAMVCCAGHVQASMNESQNQLLASTFLGSSGIEGADYVPEVDIARDADGNIFVVGITRSADFPTTPGAVQDALNGEADIFIAKFNSDLTILLAATLLGGDQSEQNPRMCLDEYGNVFVVGATNSTNFPTTPGAYDADLSGDWDIFVSKLDGSLSALLASTYLGGDGTEDFGFDLAISQSGDLYVAGYTTHSSFPTTAGAYDESYNGGSSDLFVSKLDPSLDLLQASTFIGGTSQDEKSVSVDVDMDGNVFVMGSTGSEDYPTTPLAYDTTFNGPYSHSPSDLDLCVSKLTNDLTTLLASTFVGGSGFERAYRLVVDGSGNVFLTGHTGSVDYPVTPDAFDNSHNGFDETFVSKLDNDLTQLIGSTYFTPSGTGSGFFISMVPDAEGHLWLAGGTSATDFPVTNNAMDPSYNGDVLDALVVRLGAACDTLLYATFLGGSGRDLDAAIVADGSHGIYVAGYTASSDFPMTGDGYDTNYNGNQDAYVVKLTTAMFTRITGEPFDNDTGTCMGVSWIDYDNDDYPDLFVPVLDGLNHLYRNNGDGSFIEPAGNIISTDGGSNAGCWADYDNDGDLDAYVANGLHENVENCYYLNNGDGSFVKVTDNVLVYDQAASLAAVCADYNKDGALDIFTPSWLFSGASDDQLYQGTGDGTFTKITSGAIVDDLNPSGNSLWIDYDDDGDQDLIVSKVGATSDVLFRNDGTEFVAVTGLDFLMVESGQNFDFGDFDNDGDQDLFIPTWSGHNSALFENTGGGVFVRVTDQPIASDGHWSTASCSGDFDNDGDLDLYLVNDNNYEDRPDYFYINDGTGVFLSRVDSSMVDHTGQYSCKVATGDYDRDGDLDLYVVNWYPDEANLLYKNTGNSNNWLVVQLEGVESSRSAIGSKVRVLANINGNPVWQMRELRSHIGSRAQGPLELHFGLGDAAIVERINVEWPNGLVDILTNVSVNQFLAISEASTDPDEDGIASLLDNCPLKWNPGQEDADLDGIGDSCDICPNDFNPNQEDLDGDGIGDSCEILRSWYVLPDGSGDVETVAIALDSCMHGDTILLGDGVFPVVGEQFLNFQGRRIFLISKNDPGKTIIDCQGSAGTPRRAFTFDQVQDSAVIIQGVTLRGGYGPLVAGSSTGGAVACVGVSPTFRRCVFVNNEALLGGALYITQAEPQFINCSFAGNSGMYGAVVFAFDDAQPLFENCLLAFNENAVPVYCLEGSSVALSCCDVYGNAIGDYLGCLNGQMGVNGNFSADPLLCNAGIGDVGLADHTSPCLPGNNDCAVLIGAMGLECMNPCECGLMGDVDGSSEINPVDVVYMVNFVYKNQDARVQPPNCPYQAGDVNCDEATNPVDVVYYVNFVYKNLTPWPCEEPCGMQ